MPIYTSGWAQAIEIAMILTILVLFGKISPEH